MGRPLVTAYTFKNGDAFVSFSENKVIVNGEIGKVLEKAVKDLEDHQLLNGLDLNSLERAEFVKNLTSLEYETQLT